MTLKDEFSRSVGAQYATAEQWRNNSRKNRERGKAKNKTKQNKNIEYVTEDGSKICNKQVKAVMNNIAYIGAWNVR